jgi:ABC-type transport system involved in cytochrome c biogenesis ATPase subunit
MQEGDTMKDKPKEPEPPAPDRLAAKEWKDDFVDVQGIIPRLKAAIRLSHNCALRGRTGTGKTFLIRSIIGVDRLIANDAFNNWKSAHYTARRDVFHENIAEL